MESNPDCPFCKSIQNPGEAWGENLVWSFPHSFAVLGPWQFYTGYCLLVSCEHLTELSSLGAKRPAFLEEMACLAEAIENCFRPHKLNYELLGNMVPHLHWHLFPRSADDPARLKAVWLALEEAEKNPDEKRRLQTGRVSRQESASRLREWFKAHGAVGEAGPQIRATSKPGVATPTRGPRFKFSSITSSASARRP
jgi:diadenosine tetraphosphate (Ap4A) HIT family hydrolase